MIDAFARRIVGWRASSSLRSDLALDALEQAIHDRQDENADGLAHHSDRGVQYFSIRYTERLAAAAIEPSVGSRGDWRNLEDVEFATLEWVWWFNNHRLLEPIGHVPPVEREQEYYRQQQS